jgi:NTP pyrophosphatase (non-canonical NTP hydrolase)
MKEGSIAMADLQKGASLAELQRYVSLCEAERGFSEQDSLEKCLLLGEEMGELFKAVRKATGLKTDPGSFVPDVGEELADILNYLLAIANRFDIDLDAAFAEKERVNRTRSWA